MVGSRYPYPEFRWIRPPLTQLQGLVRLLPPVLAVRVARAEEERLHTGLHVRHDVLFVYTLSR